MSSVLKWDDDTPEIKPLITLTDLLQWQPNSKERDFCRSRIPLRKHRDGGLDANRPRLLACHDMRGGYLEDRFLQGSSDNTSYTFHHWHTIDAFVYFSHHLVTIPPPGWTNAAHLHGVPVLGTFITEWEAGTTACMSLLVNDATAERAAHQLARLAEVFCFDGWIINIENEIPRELIPRLIHFLKSLTAAMHAAVPGSKVIWYDAVTTDGTLDWQNSLTPLNSPFFDACDGIWINYTWKERTPLEIRKHINNNPQRAYDIYMGIDCFGRGTYGGGGLNCHTAVTAASSGGLSVALFACAWSYERHAMAVETMNALKDSGGISKMKICDHDDSDNNGDGDDSNTNKDNKDNINKSPSSNTTTITTSTWNDVDEEFWSLIEQSWNIQRAVLCTLPFYSDFCVGAGSRLYYQGTILSNRPWYNLSMQSMIPTLRFLYRKPDSIHVRHVHDISAIAPAYTGSSCIHIEGQVSSPTVVQLFPASIAVPPTGFKSRIAVAVGGSGSTVRLCFRIQKVNHSHFGHRLLHHQLGNGSDGDDGSSSSSGGGAEEVTIEVGAVEQTNNASSGGGSGRKLLVDSTYSVVQTSKIIHTPFTIPPPSNTTNTTNNNHLLPFPVPTTWSTWEAAIHPNDLPSWAIPKKLSISPLKININEQNTSRSIAARIVSVDVIVAPRVPGAGCHCNVYIGGIGIRNVDDDGMSSVAHHHNDGNVHHNNSNTGNVNDGVVNGYVRGLRAENPVIDDIPTTNDNTMNTTDNMYSLSVFLTWSMPSSEVSHCCILMRGGGHSNSNSNSIRSNSISNSNSNNSSSNDEYRGYMMIGIATTPCYQVNGVEVSKSVKSVRIIVAPVVSGVMQSLRDAPSITIDL